MRKRKFNFWASCKECSKCKQELPLFCYHSNKSKPLGVESACKKCVSLTKKKKYREKLLRKSLEVSKLCGPTCENT